MPPTPALRKGVHQFLDAALHRSMRERARFARATGLSVPQFGILMHLHYQSNCGISDISGRFDISAAAASQMVEKLVQSGLIDRLADPKDRRAKQLVLTAQGRTMIKAGNRYRHRWLDALLKSLSAAERKKVADAVTILTRAARQLDQA
jgi:DNA-binding MarR family transcriptional regulator